MSSITQDVRAYLRIEMHRVHIAIISACLVALVGGGGCLAGALVTGYLYNNAQTIASACQQPRP